MLDNSENEKLAALEADDIEETPAAPKRTRKNTRRDDDGYVEEDLETAHRGSGEVEWFVVHSYSGYENKVRTNLEQRIVRWGCRTRYSRSWFLPKKKSKSVMVRNAQAANAYSPATSWFR